MRSVFLAPVLHPLTQSPQPEQAGCSTPASFTPAGNVTLISGSRNGLPTPAAMRSQHGGLRERVLILRVRRGPEHLAGPVHADLEGIQVVPKDLGPSLVLEDAAVGFDGDVGVHERRAAESTTLEHVDVVVDVELVQRVSLADVVLRGVDLEVIRGAEDSVRELAGEHLRPPFDEAHVARLRGPASTP